MRYIPAISFLLAFMSARADDKVAAPDFSSYPRTESRTPDIGALKMSVFFVRVRFELRNAGASGNLERPFSSD